MKRPWDDIGMTRRYDMPQEMEAPRKKVEKEERTFEGDMKNVGKHAIFGALIGGISGVSIAAIEVVRDTKAITAGSGAASRAKVMRYTGMFGVFFAGFHGMREVLNQNIPSTSDRLNDFITNTSISAGVSMAPILAYPRMRTMIPYCVVLIGLDGINAYTEGF